MSRHLATILKGGAMVLLTGACLAVGGCETAGPTTATAPTGGADFTPDRELFITTVGPLLTSKGCDNLACHGGGLRGTFQLSPFEDKDPDFDYFQASLQINPLQPSRSALLLKPLSPAAGGAVHTAPADPFGFAATDDPGYQTILAWIQTGNSHE